MHVFIVNRTCPSSFGVTYWSAAGWTHQRSMKSASLPSHNLRKRYKSSAANVAAPYLVGLGIWGFVCVSQSPTQSLRYVFEWPVLSCLCMISRCRTFEDKTDAKNLWSESVASRCCPPSKEAGFATHLCSANCLERASIDDSSQIASGSENSERSMSL